MLKRIVSVIGLCLFFSLNTFAVNVSVEVTEAQAVGNFSFGIGSLVNLKSDDSKISGEAVFLGSAVHPDGTVTYQMYLNKKSNNVYYIDSANFSKTSPNQQKVLDPYEQAGGTCTGYAMYDFLQQTNLAGFEGSGVLSQTLSSEDGRTRLLVDSINQYYLTLQHQYSIRGILNGYGKKFGFSCTSFKTDTYERVKTKILAQLKLGLPVVFSFDIGPKMVNAPFKIEMYNQKKSEIDSRLWIPRKIGERNSGGHTIVAAGTFELKNKIYLVMIDSDWSEPRIWDMDLFLNQKTAIDEVQFISCK